MRKEDAGETASVFREESQGERKGKSWVRQSWYSSRFQACLKHRCHLYTLAVLYFHVHKKCNFKIH